jgi:hypothetical protein
MISFLIIDLRFFLCLSSRSLLVVLIQVDIMEYKKLTLTFLTIFPFILIYLYLYHYHMESTNIHMDQQSFQSLTNMLIMFQIFYMIGFPLFIIALLSICETTCCCNPFFKMRFLVLKDQTLYLELHFNFNVEAP